jgi:hypothetical protein
MKNIFFALLFGSLMPVRAQPVLLASYNFTGGSGADQSGNNNNGTLFGASANADTLNIGSNILDYFTVPASLLNSRVQFSIAFRIKFTGFNISGSSPTNHLITGDDNSFAGMFGFSYQKSVDKWRVSYNNQLYDFPDNTIAPGRWYCVTLTRDNFGLMRLYVNGVQNTITNILSTPFSISGLLIGQEADCPGGCFAADQCAYAKFDDLKFYDDEIGSQAVVLYCSPATDIQDHKDKKEFQIGPNPASRELMLYNLDAAQLHVRVFSTDGKMVLEENLQHKTQASLDVQHLSPGIYFLSVVQNSSSSIIKFIKE